VDVAHLVVRNKVPTFSGPSRQKARETLGKTLYKSSSYKKE
jgi:hypothetical protein